MNDKNNYKLDDKNQEKIKDIEKKEEEKSEIYNIIESKREKINTKKN